METGTSLMLSVPQILRPSAYVSSWCVPRWVMPIAFKIGAGRGAPEAVNGITVDEGGDLVLYRKVTLDDYEKHPELIGVDEVWVTMRLTLGGD
jgi:hypothetical protein